MKYAILLTLLLSACHGNGILKGSGVETAPPWGYTKLCDEKHPDYASCPK